MDETAPNKTPESVTLVVSVRKAPVDGVVETSNPSFLTLILMLETVLTVIKPVPRVALLWVVNHAKVEVTPAASTAALMMEIANVSLAFVFII